MNFISRLTLVAAALCSAASASASAGVPEIIHTAVNNTLVRITEPGHRYLILPVEERMPDAKVDVMVGGHTEFTFYVRLAEKEVDFTVPFDLRPYTSRGDVVLNVVTATDPEAVLNRKSEEYVCWEAMTFADTFDTTNTEHYRPAFHHTPLYGWMNDPNGMFYKDGEWHLYFQHNPYGSKWQNMTWGHSVSRDLMHWTQLPNAIEPDGLGAVFSGSAVVDKGNTAGFGSNEVIAIYTSAGVSQVQSLAHSSDNGATFTKYMANPIITTEREARDPNMFWNAATGRWNLVLAHALDHEMLIYSSDDLRHWTFESAFGRGWGCQRGVWECPDLVRLPVRGTDEYKWVFICNINPGGPSGGSATQYFVGDFDGSRFVCDGEADEARWVDYGKDFYATVTWSNAPDNRCTAIAWMSNWEYADLVPTVQFRSANSLPRELDLWRAADGRLYLGSRPSPEVETLRGERRSFGPAVAGAAGVTYDLPRENGGVCEIDLDLDCRNARYVDVVLSNEAGEFVTMTYNVPRQMFAMHRQNSGITDFSDHFPVTTKAPTLNPSKRYSLRLFVDRCSVEAFDGEGRFTMTNLVFPTMPYTHVTIKAREGSARVERTAVYPMETK